MDEGILTPESLPFAGTRVYYSGSIKGAPEADRNLPWELVQFMKVNGAVVSSEHVAARTKEEMTEIRAKNIGMTVEDLKLIEGTDISRRIIRAVDLLWVYEATHVVALINAPSHGVGEEIQTAILKPRLGLNPTPILCLFQENPAHDFSAMITGVWEDECPNYFVKPYSDLEDAKRIITAFLTNKLT